MKAERLAMALLVVACLVTLVELLLVVRPR